MDTLGLGTHIPRLNGWLRKLVVLQPHQGARHAQPQDAAPQTLPGLCGHKSWEAATCWHCCRPAHSLGQMQDSSTGGHHQWLAALVGMQKQLTLLPSGRDIAGLASMAPQFWACCLSDMHKHLTFFGGGRWHARTGKEAPCLFTGMLL